MKLTSLKPLFKLKLFHISAEPDFPWRFLCGQIQFMKENGIDVHVVSSPNDYLDKIHSREKIQVHGIPISRKINPLSDISSIYSLWMLFLRERPDIVHAHTPKGSLVALIAAWLSRVPVRIYHIHGVPFLSAKGIKRIILILCDKLSCRLSTQVFCVSQSNMQIATEANLCKKAKIKVIQNGSINGIDAIKTFNPAIYGLGYKNKIRFNYGINIQSIVIGFSGRVIKEKGILELFDAWKEIKKIHNNVAIFIVGPIDDRDPVQGDILSYMKKDKNIYFTECWSDFMPPYYAAMDILVLPSHREGLGLATLEAGAMNLPVVATNIPGCVDAVEDGVTGLLVPPYDAKAIADAINKYLINSALRKKHGYAGRNRVLKKFPQIPIWEETLDSYIELLNSVDGGENLL